MSPCVLTLGTWPTISAATAAAVCDASRHGAAGPGVATFDRRMPSTVKEERRVDGPANHGEEICHIVTEEDPDTALCGKDVTGWPWNPPWPYCAVCLDLLHGSLQGR